MLGRSSRAGVSTGDVRHPLSFHRPSSLLAGSATTASSRSASPSRHRRRMVVVAESPLGTGGIDVEKSRDLVVFPVVASWGFCKQKHRSTPIGALAPTRLPVASGQRKDPPRKASGTRLRRRNLYALPTRGKPPLEISEPPRRPRQRRPGRFSDLAVKAESRIIASAEILSIEQRNKTNRHGKDSAKRPEWWTAKNQRRRQEG